MHRPSSASLGSFSLAICLMNDDWPPPPSPRAELSPRPWEPNCPLDPELGRGDVSRLRYLVVDEVVSDYVGLSVSEWPNADDQGRLHFRLDTGPLEVGTTKEELTSLLGNAWSKGPDGKPRPRPIRIGLVFAARLKRAEPDSSTPLHQWLKEPRDITAEARYVAKLTYYGSVLSTLPDKTAVRWGWLKPGQEAE